MWGSRSSSGWGRRPSWGMGPKQRDRKAVKSTETPGGGDDSPWRVTPHEVSLDAWKQHLWVWLCFCSISLAWRPWSSDYTVTSRESVLTWKTPFTASPLSGTGNLSIFLSPALAHQQAWGPGKRSTVTRSEVQASSGLRLPVCAVIHARNPRRFWFWWLDHGWFLFVCFYFFNLFWIGWKFYEHIQLFIFQDKRKQRDRLFPLELTGEDKRHPLNHGPRACLDHGLLWAGVWGWQPESRRLVRGWGTGGTQPLAPSCLPCSCRDPTWTESGTRAARGPLGAPSLALYGPPNPEKPCTLWSPQPCWCLMAWGTTQGQDPGPPWPLTPPRLSLGLEGPFPTIFGVPDDPRGEGNTWSTIMLYSAPSPCMGPGSVTPRTTWCPDYSTNKPTASRSKSGPLPNPEVSLPTHCPFYPAGHRSWVVGGCRCHRPSQLILPAKVQ